MTTPRNVKEPLSRRFFLWAIRLYQRHISPHKGFSCAYRVHTGRSSCSVLGARAVRRFGVFPGLKLLRERLHLCGVSHRRYAPPSMRPPSSQRGDCDVGCDLPCDSSCDGPSGKGLSRLCDFADCSNACSCDWPQRKDRKKDQDTYIPPKRAERQRSRDGLR
jgi:putative component of membrane protein insertase Oxa1/YidC/SpoIIIJ protein YidD